MKKPISRKGIKSKSLNKGIEVYAENEQQLDVIKDIIPILDKKGIKVRFGARVGKSPQTLVFDNEYQDGALTINGGGYESQYLPTWHGEEFSSGEDLEYIIDNPSDEYGLGGEVTKKDSYEVGDKIKYMDTFRREENDGTIYQINELGTYIVSTGMGVRGVQKEEVIGVYPKEEPKKKRFGLFAEGGEIEMEKGGQIKNYKTLLRSFERAKPSISLYVIARDVAEDFMSKKFNKEVDWEKLSIEEKTEYNNNYRDNLDKFYTHLVKEFLRMYYSDNKVKLKVKGQNRQTIDSITRIMKSIAKEYPKSKYGDGGSIAEGNYHMILSQAKEVKHHVDELQDILKNEDDIEAWVVAKMENVSSTLSDITHYLDGKSDMPMAKRGMEVDKEYEVVFQDPNSGEKETINVLASSRKEAERNALDETSFDGWEIISINETRMAKRGMKVGDSAKNRNYWLKEILKGDLIDQLSKFQEVYENSLLCQPLDADYRAKDRKEFVQKLLRVSDDVNFVVNELIDSNYLIEDYLEPSNSKELASQKKYVEKIKKLLTKLSNTLNETYAEISTNLGSISTEDGQEFDMDYYQEIQDLVNEKLNYIEEYNNSFDEKPMAKDGMKVDKIEYPSISLKEKDLNDDQAEIYAFIESRQEMQRQYDAIRKNLMAKIARGQFDESKAPKAFMKLIENGTKLYSKFFDKISLSKKEREEIANNMVFDFYNEAEMGNYENETFLPKKYLAEDGAMLVTFDIYDEDGDLVGQGMMAQDVMDYANTIWYYDMMDEDGEEIEDIDVAIDYLEQMEHDVKKSSSATKKRKINRVSKK